MSNLIFGAGFLGNIISNRYGYKLLKNDPNNILGLNKILDEEKPEIVINAIGKTGRPNIDWCENNKIETIRSNVLAATNLAMVCAERNIYFVHFSSGCIYYSKTNEEVFTEEDEPNFYNYQFYATTKILAEKMINNFPALQVRIRMPIVNYSHERNLIDKLLKYKKLINIQNSITVIDDFLKAFDIMLDKKITGTYNVVNDGTISAFEIMTMYKDIVDKNHTFELLSKEGLDEITTATRSNCILSNNKLKKIGIFLPDIHESIEKCLINYKEKLK